MRSSADPGLSRIAFLTACACSLQIAESFFPSPLPGVKLGLANMMTLVCLGVLGWRSAFLVALSRVLLSSLVLGSFLSPGFLLSLTAALTSTGIMALLYGRRRSPGEGIPGLAGISVLGSLAHGFTQVGVVYILFVRTSGLAYFLPWIALSSVAAGWVTGLLSMSVVSRILNYSADRSRIDWTGDPGSRSSRSGDVPWSIERSASDPILRFPLWTKFLFFPAAVVSAALVRNPAVLAGVYLATAAWAFGSGLTVRGFLRSVRFLAPLILISLFLPVIFERTGRVLFEAGPFSVYAGAVERGCAYGLRLLVFSAASLAVTSAVSAKGLLAGFQEWSRAAGPAGKALKDFLGLLVLSLSWLGPVWNAMGAFLRPVKKSQKGTLSINRLADLVAGMFHSAGARPVSSSPGRSPR